MGLILRETPSSLSPSANSVGNGRNPQDFGFNTSCYWGFLADILVYLLGAWLSVSTLLLIHHLFPWGEVKTVRIKPMLARLQSAMGRDDLIDQIVLLPEPKRYLAKKVKTAKPFSLIVSYDGSPNSHTALDLAFWMAHQTRLATNEPVTVQAVYVVEENYRTHYSKLLRFAQRTPTLECPINDISTSATPVLTQTKLREITPDLEETLVSPLQKADRVLWQARSLAEEWQGSFKSHLRFGNIASELRKVVESEAADILFLGCKSVYHPIVEALDNNLPCAVLGIPKCID